MIKIVIMIMSNTVIKPILKQAYENDNMLDWKSFSWRMGKGGGGEFVKTLQCCADAVVTRKFGFMK